MESRLASTVFHVLGKEQRRIEKNLLHFRLGNAVLLILPGISLVPFKSGVGSSVRHERPLYMSAIYHKPERFCRWTGSAGLIRQCGYSKSVVLPRLSIFRLRQRSLLRGIVLSLGALLASMRLAGFPNANHLHASNWQFLPVIAAAWGMVDTARCLSRKWSLYHAGVLILLYSELMTLAMAVFLWVYPL
jgi:hypothetical protein